MQMVSVSIKLLPIDGVLLFIMKAYDYFEIKLFILLKYTRNKVYLIILDTW